MDRIRLVNFPVIVFASSIILLWLSGRLGSSFREKKLRIDDTGADAGLLLGGTLTLLGLIIGFAFSMATSRYEQRKNYEAEEANAIGTEYVRTDLVPAADGQRIRALLVRYTAQRILFYQTVDEQQLRRVNADTAQLQNELWSAVLGPAASQPTALTALVVSGMNDVLNSEGYTQAAWWNRIPASAWGLMAIIAICCNMLVGFSIRRTYAESVVFSAMTVVVSISFFLIADIDSPRGGVIRIQPQNLYALADSLKPE